MNKTFRSIGTLVGLLRNGIKRFYTNSIFTFIVFGIAFYLINWDRIDYDVIKTLQRIIFVCVLGFLLSVLITLIRERINIDSKLLKTLNVIVSFGVPILYFFFIFTDFLSKYQVATIIGICLALIFVAVYFSNKTTNEDFSFHFSYLLKTFFSSAIITLVVMLGLFLCATAVYFLIYEFSDLDKILATIASFCWVILFVNIFLAMLPEESMEYKTPKFFKVITLYTALPVYTGLLVILYIYLSKIIITHNFPSGQLNWFASFASLIGIFLFLSLKQYHKENGFVKWLVRLIGFILIPIIIMQCIAFNIRFLSYGLTSVRYISIILIGISIITAVVSLIRSGKYIPYILFLLALCAIITTTGYFNLFDIPIFEQEARIVRTLKDNSMIDENGKITPKSDIDKQAKIKITSAYNYIVSEDIEKTKLLKEYHTRKDSFNQIFGFNQEFEENEHIYLDNYHYYNSQNEEINISGYNSMIGITTSYDSKDPMNVSENVLTRNYNEKVYVIDLNNFINDLYLEYGNKISSLPQNKLVVEQEDKKLVIDGIGFVIDKNTNKIIINSIEGYIFIK